MRSTIKWSSTVLTVLLLLVWVTNSRWSAAVVFRPTVECGLECGVFWYGWETPWTPHPDVREYGLRREYYAPNETLWLWWFDFDRANLSNGRTYVSGCIPIWFVALLPAIPTSWLWYRDRRRARGHCPHCNYNLHANTTGTCPECGTATPNTEINPTPE